MDTEPLNPNPHYTTLEIETTPLQNPYPNTIRNMMNAVVVYFDPRHNIFSHVLFCAWHVMVNGKTSISTVAFVLPATLMCVVTTIVMMVIAPPGGFSHDTSMGPGHVLRHEAGKAIAAYTRPLLFTWFMDNAVRCLIFGFFTLCFAPFLHRPRNIISLGSNIMFWLTMSYFLASITLAYEMIVDTSTSEGVHLKYRYGSILGNFQLAWYFTIGVAIIGQILTYAWKIRQMVNQDNLYGAS